MTSILVVGFNYKTADLAIREQAYFPTDKVAFYLQDLLQRGIAEEAVLLSTCNRTELICYAKDSRALFDWFSEVTQLKNDILQSVLYIHKDKDAVMHIMKVASGLDSMILGEPQILGQMKAAFLESCAAQAIGSLFHRMFQHLFSFVKEIRTTTAVGACPVSVASTAVRFAKEKYADFEKAKIAIIGAGETAQLLLRYLADSTSLPLLGISRNRDKVLEMGILPSHAYSFEEFPTVLTEADIIFSATGSAVPILSLAFVEKVMVSRKRKLLLIDIAVPRDVDPAIKTLPYIELYCIDDLKTIILQHQKSREHAAEKALEMINKKSEDFITEIKSWHHVAHTIKAYREQIEELCSGELMKAKEQLSLGKNPANVLDTFAHAFTQKLLHGPSLQLRQAGAEGKFELVQLAKLLFTLPDHELEVSP